MQEISCYVNFKEKLNKNVPYYSLLMRRINAECADTENLWIGEDAALCIGTSCGIVSSICEGYQFTIAFCGELENGIFLRKELSSFGYLFHTEKDAEVALYSYIHFGEKCTEKLLGSYSFIIYDAMRRQVFAALGKDNAVPLFYAQSGGGFIISSSIKGILEHPDVPKRLSSEKLLELLSAQNRISSDIFEDVHMLASCRFLKISKNKLLSSDFTAPENQEKLSSENCTGVILSGTSLDRAILEFLTQSQKTTHRIPSVYIEKCYGSKNDIPDGAINIPTDDGSILYGIESCISNCGFPFLSDYDYFLPVALRRAKSSDESLFFSAPDRFLPKKNYIATLIKNNAFYTPIEKNISGYEPLASIFPSYPQLIANRFDIRLKTPIENDGTDYNEVIFQTKAYSSEKKTALRHILLDIISKEYSPITAFFRRASLLRLCEGRFTFLPNQSECELTAYLIKLNMWFEMYRPRII